MQLAFVDDSKQDGRRAQMGKLIALGAVVFDEDQLKPFADSFYAAYDALGVPHEVELKWAPGKSDWFRENGKTELITPLREAVLDAAATHHAKVVSVVWDTGGGWEKMWGRAAEVNVLQFLFERVSMLIENLEKIGVMVFDKPGGDHRDEDKWIGDTLDLTAVGTEYVKANAIVIPILTAPSHHHPHLQLADLVTGSITAAVSGNRYGLALVPKLLPLFHRNWLGQVGGTGLKLWPDRLNNLQRWVLGERDYMRGHVGVSLPWPGWRYSEDNGL